MAAKGLAATRAMAWAMAGIDCAAETVATPQPKRPNMKQLLALALGLATAALVHAAPVVAQPGLAVVVDRRRLGMADAPAAIQVASRQRASRRRRRRPQHLQRLRSCATITPHPAGTSSACAMPAFSTYQHWLASPR
jgi:hypothetical protein